MEYDSEINSNEHEQDQTVMILDKDKYLDLISATTDHYTNTTLMSIKLSEELLKRQVSDPDRELRLLKAIEDKKGVLIRLDKALKAAELLFENKSAIPVKTYGNFTLIDIGKLNESDMDEVKDEIENNDKD